MSRFHSLLVGRKAEEMFKELAEHRGWECIKSNSSEDKYHHFDFTLTNYISKYSYNPFSRKSAVQFTVDVKAMKKITRTDDTPQDSWTWLELRGSYENLGWIFGGKAVFIVFETEEEFIFVRRTDLIEYLNSGVINDITVKNSKEAYYNKYLRTQRGDIITLVRTDDLIDICVDNWKKQTHMILPSTLNCEHVYNNLDEFQQTLLNNQLQNIYSDRLRQQFTKEFFETRIVNYVFCPKCGTRLDSIFSRSV